MHGFQRAGRRHHVPRAAAGGGKGGASDAPAAVAERQAVDLRGRGLILVVDDEQVVRQMATQALERYGYQVLAAEDGARGLEIFQREASRLHAWCWT